MKSNISSMLTHWCVPPLFPLSDTLALLLLHSSSFLSLTLTRTESAPARVITAIIILMRVGVSASGTRPRFPPGASFFTFFLTLVVMSFKLNKLMSLK